ncbi:MAG: serine hydrolase [Bacteroidota bacterium]
MDTTEQYLNMNLREMLAHQARLLPWIPFYQKTLVKGQPRYDIYSLAPSKTYPHRVAENLYIHKDYPQTILSRIVDSPLRKKHGYKYSDLGYYFLKEIVERQTGQPLDAYMHQAFYAPLGMTTMTYRPLEKFPKKRLVPTEYDLAFRKQQIQGDVHDPGAAMMGGVAGHAGLFSNANDLAKLMQLYLNGGTYGGEQLLTQATIDDFSRCQFCDDDNRRGAGFDKPTAPGESGPTCDCVSGNSFGHSGFTGTITWADTDEEVIYVFLSNRVYPDARNKKLVEMNIRTNIMQVVYDAVNNAKAITRR